MLITLYNKYFSDTRFLCLVKKVEDFGKLFSSLQDFLKAFYIINTILQRITTTSDCLNTP